MNEEIIRDAKRWRMFFSAHGTIGIYPQSVRGGEKPYEKRTDYMNGWNACAMALIKAHGVIEKAFYNLLPEEQEHLQDLLDEEIVWWVIDGEEEGSKGTLVINVNDTFGYACADSEDMTFNDINPVYELYKDFGYDGVVAWVAKNRNEDPIKPRMTEKYKQAKERLTNVRK